MGEAWNFPVGSKLCFVTTGSTAAPFAALLESVLSPPCLDTLREYGFTHLLVQHGCAKVEYDEHANSARLYLKISHAEQTLNIDGFDWNLDGLKAQYKLVHQSRGLVISHAGMSGSKILWKNNIWHLLGSGSILEALRFQIPIVVVPNKKLLNNHQEELAVAMEHKNYLVHGDVEYVIIFLGRLVTNSS
jgi:beta-1,4-N-acetylglucosaminyltransferase